MQNSLMNMLTKIDAKRLYLRAYRAGDGPLLFAAGQRNADHLAEFESGNLIMHLRDEAHAETVAQELAANWATRDSFFLGIFDKQSDNWAGQVYVALTNRALPEFTIGYVADRHFEGKGYISEAVNAVLGVLFGLRGAQRVGSDCNEHNIRSWRLLERCGFTREGHLRENKRNADGTVHGDFLYGLLRREYFAAISRRDATEDGQSPAAGVIVVLGSPNDDQGRLASIALERCEQAWREFQVHPDYRVLPTGGWGAHFNTTDKPHGHYTREELMRRGVPETAFLPCALSSHTGEDATLARPILGRHPDAELIVVTSDFHAARARFIFAREFPARKIIVLTAKTDLPVDELVRLNAHEEQALARLKSSKHGHALAQ